MSGMVGKAVENYLSGGKAAGLARVLFFLRRRVWLPIPLFVVATLVLHLIGNNIIAEPPYLLLVLNLVFCTAVMLFVAYLSARSFTLSPSPAVLFLGCGSLSFGTVSTVSAIAIHLGLINLALTVYNSGMFIAGVCMLFSAVMMRPEGHGTLRHSMLLVNILYFLVLIVIGVLTIAAWLNLTPPFFIQGQGGTLLRQIILSLAVGFFALAGVVVALNAARQSTDFAVWFSSGLGLIACGLFAVLIIDHVGSPVGWLGRLAQYLGGIYIFIAILLVLAGSRNLQLSLQEMLQKSEERFRMAASAAGLGTFSRNYLTGGDSFSDEYLAIFGLKSGDRLDMKEGLPAAIHPEDRQQVLIRHDACRKKELPAEFNDEYRIIRSDGQVRWLSSTGRMHFSSSGHAISEHGIIRDITERRQAEENLRESEERFRVAIKNSSFIPAQFDRKLRYQWIHNPHPDFDQSAVLGRRDDELGDSEGERRLVQLKEEVIESGTGVREEIDFLRSDGIHTYDFTIEPLFDGNGVVIGGTSAAFDVTDRKRIEEKLRRSEQLLRNVLDNLVALVGVMTPEGILIEANNIALDLAGIGPDDVVGKLFAETYWWSWSAEVQERLRQAVSRAAAGETIRYDETIQVAGGRTLAIDFMLAPILDEQGKVKYLIPSAIDISERKRAEEERERLIADLEAANRELQGFTYSVSHDLRAPIRHMNSFALLLKQEAWSDLSEQSRLFLSTVLKSSEKMSRLVDDLLDFSRMAQVEMKKDPVDLNLIFDEVRKNIMVETRTRDIRWKVSHLPTVNGDAAMLQLVFENLIGNAVKFTQSRTTAVIEICHEEKKTERIIIIRDNGIGFDMKYYNRLFGIFERLHTDDVIEGTGIGLANVARIVGRHGGRAWAEGKVDEGAVFYIAFPREEDEQQ